MNLQGNLTVDDACMNIFHIFIYFATYCNIYLSFAPWRSISMRTTVSLTSLCYWIIFKYFCQSQVQRYQGGSVKEAPTSLPPWATTSAQIEETVVVTPHERLLNHKRTAIVLLKTSLVLTAFPNRWGHTNSSRVKCVSPSNHKQFMAPQALRPLELVHFHSTCVLQISILEFLKIYLTTRKKSLM